MNLAQSVESEVRSKRLPSAAAALIGTFLLSRLPVAAVIGSIVRAALSLVRPALLVLGIAKAIDLVRDRKRQEL